MEPARQGRDDAGGQVVVVADVRAAMEPARQGRDDMVRRARRVAAEGAAMEPARQGRDDSIGMHELSMIELPQWSPPVRGGTTPVTRVSVCAHVSGRNGARPSGAGRRRADQASPGPSDRRNGARPSGAGRLAESGGKVQATNPPQWSPPVRGGTTF